MRLLTHNYLQSNVKGTTKGYPLRIEATEVSVEDNDDSAPMDAELVTKILPKLEYSAIVAAVADLANQVENLPEIPKEFPSEEDLIENPSILEALHHVLFNIHILEGNLICPDTGRKFPIKQGIPNMILHEDEI